MDDRTFGEPLAGVITRFGGSWPFHFLFLGLSFIRRPARTARSASSP